MAVTCRPAHPFDINSGHPARVYDYILNGKDNYAADRHAAERWIKADHGMVHSVRANRAFLGRAVKYLAAERGIRQFLDLGAGMPAPDSTHQVAQSAAPGSRVVYVDFDRCKSGCAHAHWAGQVTEPSPRNRAHQPFAPKRPRQHRRR